MSTTAPDQSATSSVTKEATVATIQDVDMDETKVTEPLQTAVSSATTTKNDADATNSARKQKAKERLTKNKYEQS